MSDAIDPRIATILRTVGELADDVEITAEQELNADLGIDSLLLIDVIVNVEAELGIDMGDDFSRDMRTVGELDETVMAVVKATSVAS